MRVFGIVGSEVCKDRVSMRCLVRNAEIRGKTIWSTDRRNGRIDIFALTRG